MALGIQDGEPPALVPEGRGMTDCKHEFHYYPAVNEDGWQCCYCKHKPGEPAGYSPQIDRELLYIKVDGLLRDLVMHGFVHVSNGSAGDSIAHHVAQQMRSAGTFDQYSIVAALVVLMNGGPSDEYGHAAYWKRVGEGVISGHDIRDRCHCGALSKMTVIANGQTKHFCSSECESQGDLPF